MHEDSALHQKVLQSLKKLKVPGHGTPLVEETGGRLDLPNNNFQLNRKGEAQRKRSLCYIDAIIHAERLPRVLIEVVDKNPTSPNGITGLTVNVDRIAEFHKNIDLIFVVLAEMKNFYCSMCRCGHRLLTRGRATCFKLCLGANPNDEAFGALIHEGKAANFKKALIDYPISRYLDNISPPSVLFLNLTKVAEAWDTYEAHALRLISEEIAHITATARRSEPRLVAVREVIPDSITVPRYKVDEFKNPNNWPEDDHRQGDQSIPPPPGSFVTWESPYGPQRVVIKNRGRHNTRVRFPDGRTEKVTNRQLS
jgi:hypothetical protein